MSKKSRNDSHPADPDVLAVLHEAGGSWRLLVAREGRHPTILEAAVFPSAMPDTGGPTADGKQSVVFWDHLPS